MAKDSLSAIGKKPLRAVHLRVLPCLTSYLIVPLMAHCSRRGLSVLMLEVRVPGQCLWLVMQFSCIEVPLDPQSLGSFKNHLDFNQYEWPSSECLQSWQIGEFIWHVFTKSIFEQSLYQWVCSIKPFLLTKAHWKKCVVCLQNLNIFQEQTLYTQQFPAETLWASFHKY